MPRFLALALLAAAAHAQSASFDYFLLALSWAPNYCAQAGGNKGLRECGPGRHVAFIVHGLWPQMETGHGPERCAPAKLVPYSIVRQMIPYFPAQSLIEHEWSTHGVCSGLSVADYFAAVRKTRDALVIPANLVQSLYELDLPPVRIIGSFSAANPAFPPSAFAISCYSDGQLEEVRVCFDKNLVPRPCSVSAGNCRLRSLTMLPVN